jgi:HK97 family phage major capsid protein
MAEQIKEGAVAETVATLEKALADQSALVTKQQESLDTITKKMEEIAKQPVYKGVNPNALYGGQAPYVTSGPLGERGYSLMKAMKFTRNLCTEDEAKEEIQLSEKLKKMYDGYPNFSMTSGKRLLIPVCTQFMPNDTPDNQSTAVECRQKMLVASQGYDHDEAKWVANRYPHLNKALGTLSDLAGGALVGAPQLAGEMIELQRNKEVFPSIGARETALPPNGRVQYAKQTGGATGYWVGEETQITASEPTTGNLTLEAKKAAVLVKSNNELFRFANPAAEMLVRVDAAEVAARLIDLAMLQGTGGTQIKGIITYSDISSITASTVATDGNTFQPEDIGRMWGALPDVVEGFTAYVMRRAMAAALMNRRAAAVAPSDSQGPFVFDLTRSAGMGPPREFGGAKLVTSQQVSATREKGASEDLTYILGCYGHDWIIARLGVAELMMANQGDTAFTYDQTWLRLIQHLDAGPRHAASFVLCDQLEVA